MPLIPTARPHAGPPSETSELRPSRRRTPLAAALVAALAAVLLAPQAALPARAASAAVAAAVPPPGPAATATIEAMGGYVADASCDAATKPGTARLASLLTATWPGTVVGTARACGTDGSVSEHYDGRAVDWMTPVRTPEGAARADAFIAWLFATDSQGNAFAEARRLGIMYLIWNNRIWGAYRPTDGWRPYSSCASHPESSWDTACHRDHVHISLTWEGGMGRTSYWTGRAAVPDYGPCRVPDLTWAPPYAAARTTPCPGYPAVPVPAGASSLTVRLIAASGALLGPGSSGTPVGAVNELLGLGAGTTWTGDTTTRLRSYQAARSLPQTGVMDVATWRATTGAAVLAASVPTGHLDRVAAAGTTAISASGWGVDGESDATLGVRVTVDGVATTTTANTYRPDVARTHPGRSDYHGFSATVSATAGEHRVCVDLLNVGLGHDVAFGCSTVTVATPLAAFVLRSRSKSVVRVLITR